MTETFPTGAVPESTSKTDARIREERLVFYRQDVEDIDRVLEEFLALSNAKCVLLIDRDGHLVTRKGELPDVNADSIAALVAGSFAATREMARMLGEKEFRSLHHQGSKDHHIQVNLVGNRTLFTVLFDERTTLGMVRFYSNESSARLQEVLEFARHRQRSAEEEVKLGDGFADAARDTLGEILGG